MLVPDKLYLSTIYSKNVSSQRSMTAQIEPVQDKNGSITHFEICIIQHSG